MHMPGHGRRPSWSQLVGLGGWLLGGQKPWGTAVGGCCCGCPPFAVRADTQHTRPLPPMYKCYSWGSWCFAAGLEVPGWGRGGGLRAFPCLGLCEVCVARTGALRRSISRTTRRRLRRCHVTCTCTTCGIGCRFCLTEATWREMAVVVGCLRGRWTCSVQILLHPCNRSLPAYTPAVCRRPSPRAPRSPTPPVPPLPKATTLVLPASVCLVLAICGPWVGHRGVWTLQSASCFAPVGLRPSFCAPPPPTHTPATLPSLPPAASVILLDCLPLCRLAPLTAICRVLDGNPSGGIVLAHTGVCR
jgi:hypothetical protein